jgi:uncharacterized protein (TIGR02284 family)
MLATKDTIDQLNSLLRGEISATETYTLALEKLPNDVTLEEIRRLRDDHRSAANTWRQHIHQFGGEPVQGSGAWGLFAKATQGVATIFGKEAVLKTLKEGEERGLTDYENALKKEDLPLECQQLIRTLIPQTQEHVRLLDGMMAQSGG